MTVKESNLAIGINIHSSNLLISVLGDSFEKTYTDIRFRTSF